MEAESAAQILSAINEATQSIGNLYGIFKELHEMPSHARSTEADAVVTMKVLGDVRTILAGSSSLKRLDTESIKMAVDNCYRTSSELILALKEAGRRDQGRLVLPGMWRVEQFGKYRFEIARSQFNDSKSVLSLIVWIGQT